MYCRISNNILNEQGLKGEILMKSTFLFVLLLFSVSLVSATDCWQLTSENGSPECLYVSFENCEDIYYDEFYDCERERLDIGMQTDNIIQKITESVTDYESESLTKLYSLTNIQIFLIGLFCYLLYWMIRNK